VVTVGVINGGLKRNIIPEEVKLELTLRAFDEKVMAQLIAAIRRICAGVAQAAGLSDDRLPVITLTPESVGVTENDPALARRLTATFVQWFGRDRARVQEPIMGAEDSPSLAGNRFQYACGGLAPPIRPRSPRANAPESRAFEPFLDLRPHPRTHAQGVCHLDDRSRAGVDGRQFSPGSGSSLRPDREPFHSAMQLFR